MCGVYCRSETIDAVEWKRSLSDKTFFLLRVCVRGRLLHTYWSYSLRLANHSPTKLLCSVHSSPFVQVHASHRDLSHYDGSSHEWCRLPHSSSPTHSKTSSPRSRPTTTSRLVPRPSESPRAVLRPIPPPAPPLHSQRKSESKEEERCPRRSRRHVRKPQESHRCPRRGRGS